MIALSSLAYRVAGMQGEVWPHFLLGCFPTCLETAFAASKDTVSVCAASPRWSRSGGKSQILTQNANETKGQGSAPSAPVGFAPAPRGHVSSYASMLYACTCGDAKEGLAQMSRDRGCCHRRPARTVAAVSRRQACIAVLKRDSAHRTAILLNCDA